MANDSELQFAPRWFTVVLLPFYPPIPMVQASALSLAAKLGAQLSLTDIHMSDEVWEYRRPHATEGAPRGLIKVTVKENEIRIEHRFPASGLEQFERLLNQVLSSFDKPFAPRMVFATAIELDYIVDLKADSRESLLCGLRLFDNDDDDTEANKIAEFKRPCHLVGLRLGFPPYKVKPDTPPQSPPESPPEPWETPPAPVGEQAPEGADWEAVVTLTTLDDDPTKISAEIKGSWVDPCPWEEIHGIIVNRIAVLSDFLRGEIASFLKHFRGADENEKNDPGA